jgi:hypothetical protein
MSFGRIVQAIILLVFLGEFIAMSFGVNVVPTESETKQYFFGLHGVLLTLLNVAEITKETSKGSKDAKASDITNPADL